MYAERLPPHDIASEEAVLGCILIDAKAWPVVSAILEPSDFYRERDRWVFEAMQGQETIDQVTVAHALDRAERLAEAGGLEYLSHLISVVPTPLHAEAYARLVKKCADARKLIEAAGELATLGYDGDPYTSDPIVKRVRSLLSATNTKRPQTIGEIVDESFDELSDEVEGVAIPMGLETGLALDEVIRGFEPGKLYVVGGATSVGKTTFVLHIAAQIADRHHKVLFNSLEMGRKSLLRRLMYGKAGLRRQDNIRGKLTEENRTTLRDAWNWVDSLKEHLLIDDTPGLTVAQVYARAEQIEGLEIVVIDYLTRLRPRSETEEKRLQASGIASDVKTLAQELGIPVILVSQLNREYTDRPGRYAKLSDLKESGDIENDADVVMLLYHYDYFVRQEPGIFRPDPKKKNQLEVGIAKNREGETGTVKLFYDPKTGKIGNLSREEEP